MHASGCSDVMTRTNSDVMNGTEVNEHFGKKEKTADAQNKKKEEEKYAHKKRVATGQDKEQKQAESGQSRKEPEHQRRNRTT